MSILTLEHVQEFLSQLAQNSESVYWLGDPNFIRLAYVSPAYERIWGRSREPLYHNPAIWIEHLHPDDQSRHPILAMKQKIDKQGIQARFVENYRIIRPNKEVRWILDRGFPIQNSEGHIIAITGVAVDITREMQIQKKLQCAKEMAESASQAKSAFIANMLHDIRTPITGILGILESLLHVSNQESQYLSSQSAFPGATQLTHRFKKFCEQVRHDSTLLEGAANELLTLCNAILEAFKAETGERTHAPIAFDLPQLMHSHMTLFEPVAKNKGLALSLAIADTVPRYVLGIRPYIDGIFLNLISNALKFTAKGFVSIEVRLLDVQANTVSCTGDTITIECVVKDSGIGIPNDKFKAIFEHFSRLTPSFSSIYKGHGLGLYVVKQYVNILKGTITVDSQVGVGSQFTVHLPLAVSDHSDYCPPEGQPQHLLPVSSPRSVDTMTPHAEADAMSAEVVKGRILVVEDNRLVALVVQRTLNRLRYEVDIASTGQTGLDRVKHYPYDLVLMDIGLPDQDGLTITRTGHMDKRDQCLAAGMQDLLIKPARSKDLLAVLERYVGISTPTASSYKALVNTQTIDDSLPWIDWDRCVALYGGDVAVAREMVLMCLTELPQILDQLEKLYTMQDVNALKSELHRCLGGICYVKLVRLEAALRACQAVANMTPLDAPALKTSYTVLIQMLRDYIERHKAGQLI